MKIVVSEIPDEGINLSGKLTFALQDGGDGVVARYDLHIRKSGSDVFISGSLSARGPLLCSRCLKDFLWEMQGAVDAIYVSGETVESEHDHELMLGDLNTAFYSGDEIDLDELVEEQVLLSMPMKPLCGESCRGICAQCGADLNTKQCDCRLSHKDSRFQVLEKLLHKGKE